MAVALDPYCSNWAHLFVAWRFYQCYWTNKPQCQSWLVIIDYETDSRIYNMWTYIMNELVEISTRDATMMAHHLGQWCRWLASMTFRQKPAEKLPVHNKRSRKMVEFRSRNMVPVSGGRLWSHWWHDISAYVIFVATLSRRHLRARKLRATLKWG